MSKNDVSPEKYCYSIAESAVHYSNKVTEWTPNNIKRLIISPDMVVVQLHTYRRFITKQFIPEKYAICVLQPKYKKMVSVLGGDGNNVCSHVEEIIYCLQGENGGFLHNEEANLRSILMRNSGAANEALLIKELGNRFKRLYAVCQYNGTIRQLINTSGSRMLADAEYHVADEADVNATFIHKDDWYKGFFFRPANYPADKEGGKLFNHLHKISADIMKRMESAKSEAARRTHLGEVDKKLQKELSQFKGVFSCCGLLCAFCALTHSLSYFAQTDLAKFRDRFLGIQNITKAVLPDTGDFNDTLKGQLTKAGIRIVPMTDDEKEEIVKCTETLHLLTMKYYDNLQSIYTDVFNTLAERYPLTVHTYFDNWSCKINMLNDRGISINGEEISFDKANLQVSVVNMCSQLAEVYADEEHRIKVADARYWNKYYDDKSEVKK